MYESVMLGIWIIEELIPIPQSELSITGIILVYEGRALLWWKVMVMYCTISFIRNHSKYISLFAIYKESQC